MSLIKAITMIQPDTIEVVYHDHIKIDVEGIREGFIQLDKFSEMKRFKKLIIIGKDTEISKEARTYGHSESKLRKNSIIAEALVVHTLPQKMAANFYTAFIKDTYPTKYFTEIEKAKEWLAAINDN